MAAEYVMSSGNPNVILCERGIRTFETAYRNTLDITAVPLRPPADPPAGDDRPVATPPGSAGWCRRWRSRGPRPAPTACSSRSTPGPIEALSDGDQSVTPAQFAELADRRPRRPRAGPGDPRHPRARDGRRRARLIDATVTSVPAAPRPSPSGPPPRLRGEIRLPGDKSISHRALLLALLADGESRIAGAGDGRDVRATAAVVAALGAIVERSGDDPRAVDYRVVSPGPVRPPRAGRRPRLPELRDDVPPGGRDPRRPPRLRRPRRRRLAARPADGPGGRPAGGDGCHHRRPCRRHAAAAGDHGPRARSSPSTTRRPFRSAQVKSAILLAGLAAAGTTTVREPVATRDHTERMLRARGVAGAHGAAARRRGRPRGRRRRRTCARWTSASPATSRAPRSGWWRRRPPGRRADPPGRRHEPDPACDHRPAATDGRRRSTSAPSARRATRRAGSRSRTSSFGAASSAGST